MRSLIPSRSIVCLIGLLALQACLLGWSAARHSPGIDEIGHIAAGLHHWKTGSFDLYRVNPPLVRLVATTPLSAMRVELPEGQLNTVPPARPEFDLGRHFADQCGMRTFWCFTLARWACIPFAWLGTAMIYLWGASLYGRNAGLLSASLWVVCPNVLANAQMITPDTGAAGLGLAACYLFWRWLRRPGWGYVWATGIVLGVTELSKTTWVLLGPIWMVSWAFYSFGNPHRTGLGRWAELRQLVATFTIALYVLNAGYGFEDVGRPLGQMRFISQALTTEAKDGERVNRFRDTWVGRVRVPLPQNYVEGIDVQKRDFEIGMWSYLRGEWRTEGWWYYYLYGLSIKTPLGTIVLLGMAAASGVLSRGSHIEWRDELVLLLPGLTVLTFVSSQTGFNHHLRYVLPALPFVFVWIGRVIADSRPGRPVWRSAVGIAAVATAMSSLSVYPHSMSYFNEVVGGPTRGSEHLVDSNIDWGQDLLHLKEWLNEHPEAQPLGLAYFGLVDPRIAGIEFSIPPRLPAGQMDLEGPDSKLMGPRPGWYAVSVTMLRGYRFPIPDGDGRLENIDTPAFAYFLDFEPIARAGYSINIYRLTVSDCNRVRQQRGMPQLPR